MLKNNVKTEGNNQNFPKSKVFMKNPNNNSVNYCKSLFLEMAGPLNPDGMTQ